MKRIRLIAIGILLGAFLIGMAGFSIVDTKAAESTSQDRLIGVLVTTRHLDRVDATLTERTLTNQQTGATSKHKEYVFDGIAGIPYFSATIISEKNGDMYTVGGSDAAISDGKNAISITDAGTSVSLEGTVYIAPKDRENFYYFNPVFQSSDGRVFATSGQGLQFDVDMAEGAAYSQKLDASQTITENGKVKSDAFSVKLSLAGMYPPERIVLIQMDSGSTILSRSEFTPGQVPKSITPDKKTAYIVTETHKKGPSGQSKVARTLTGREAKTLETFWAREDGICIKQFTDLNWQG